MFVEQHHPGWAAEVDGRAVPLLRANHCSGRYAWCRENTASG